MPAPISETLLTAIPGLSDEDRLLLVLCQEAGGNYIELRQQSWGIGVGWFTQSSVKLAPHQVAELRSSLGISAGSARRATATTLPGEFTKLRVGDSHSREFYPRVVRADSA